MLKLQGISISDKAVRRGIEKTKNPARCEIVSDSPFVIFDGCHNEDSAKALRFVIDNYLKGRKINAVMGMMEDKDVRCVLELLTPCFNTVFTVTPSNPRSMKSDKLASMIESFGTHAVYYADELDGLRAAVASTGKDDVLLVCGSLYLCSDLYKYFKKSDD